MTNQKEKKQSLIVRTGQRYGVDSDKLLVTLKSTAFRNENITNEQMMALLVVAEKYDLNPFVNELYAFPSRSGGIVPVVGVDGWLQIINRHPKFEGMEIIEADETKAMPGAKECPEWMEVKIYVKGRQVPVIVREYLDEVYREPPVKNDKVIPGPWQTHTKRMLRHKTIIQGGRVAFGLSGIYEEDEAQRVLEAQEQAIDAEIVPEIEDVEGKFKGFIDGAGISDADSAALVKYMDETAVVSGLSGEELMKNLVVAFTADKKEISNFVESFRSWQEKNAPTSKPESGEFTPPPPPPERTWEGHNQDINKKQLIAEIDQMVEALDDPGKAEEILAKFKLELGNLSAGNVEELEAIRGEVSTLIDKQTEMFK